MPSLGEQPLLRGQALFVHDTVERCHAALADADKAAPLVQALGTHLLYRRFEVQAPKTKLLCPLLQCSEESPPKPAALAVGVYPHALYLGAPVSGRLKRPHCDETSPVFPDQKFAAAPKILRKNTHY